MFAVVQFPGSNDDRDLCFAMKTVLGAPAPSHGRRRASPDDPDESSGGEIYDPVSGRTYRVVARMDGADRLHLRSYLGIRLPGRTTTWIRVGSEQRFREHAQTR